MSTLIHINYLLFQDINAPAGTLSWLDIVMIFFANWLIFLWPIFLLLVWGLPVKWRKRPLRPGELALVEESRAAILWVIIACALAYAFNLLIEQFVFEPRPFVSHKVHLLVSHAADASFPSDHLAWSFAVIGMLLFAFLPFFTSTGVDDRASPRQSLLRKPVWYLIAAFVIGCCIGYARVYVGVHYPGDILGGAIDGLIAALIVTAIRHWLSRPTRAILSFVQALGLA
jgi:undecaprenyl-diphosphatase